MCDDAVLRASVMNSTADLLIAGRVATPWPWQWDVVKRCVHRARGEGISLPTIEVCWRERQARALICAGAVSFERGRNPKLYLAIDSAPPQLERTVFHEVRHISDYMSYGFDALKSVEARIEMERRADDFANKMIGNLNLWW